jgi:hypothetical protein
MDRAAYVCQKRKLPYPCGSIPSNDVYDCCGQAGCDCEIRDLNGSPRKRNCTADPLSHFFTSRWNSGAQGWSAPYCEPKGNFSQSRNGGFPSASTHLTSNDTPQSLYDHQPLAVPLPYAVAHVNYGMYAEKEVGRAGSVSSQTTGTIFANKNSALDDSSSYYGSHELSRAESQHETPGTLVEIPDQFSCGSSQEAGRAFPSIEDTG